MEVTLMRVIINEVAERCGIAPAAAWQILKMGFKGVSSESYKKVTDTARELGFDSSAAPSGSLAVLYAEKSGKGLTHPFFISILNAFKNEAEALGFDVTFINNSVEYDDYGYLERCLDRNVDGVCMSCVDFSSAGIKNLIASGIPCVTVDHIFKGIPSILSDNETGVQKLLEYAISLGHKRIAFVHGHNNSIVTRTRISQFRNTMEYYKYEIPDGFIQPGLYDDIVLTRNLVTKLLRMPEPPTCILLPDDMAYLGAIEAARDLGLSIPDDISFAGYDGIELTQTLKPALTTIRQSHDEIGRVAARRLVDCIRNPEKASRKPVIFPVELIKGETMAPPKK